MTTTTKNTTGVGTCGACGGTYKVKSGHVSLHGYRRPGDGYTHGRCWGARKMAHELSPDAARGYAAALQAEMGRLAERLSDLGAGRVTTLIVLRRGPRTPLTLTPQSPDWERALIAEKAHVESTFRAVDDARASAQKRADTWVEGEIRPDRASEPLVLAVGSKLTALHPPAPGNWAIKRRPFKIEVEVVAIDGDAVHVRGTREPNISFAFHAREGYSLGGAKLYLPDDTCRQLRAAARQKGAA